MEKLNEYKYTVLMILVILGFAFYWFELRPESIKKECDKYASAMVENDLKVNEGISSINYNWRTESDSYYKSCLREQGL